RPAALNVPNQRCQYWMPEKAVFIEPGPELLGPARTPYALQELCQELQAIRPREPLDGIVVIVNARMLADFSEEGAERYAKSLRRYLIEVGQQLDVDVPAYVIVTAYDGLWGFGDAFRWSPERSREEPWGLTLSPRIPRADVPARVAEQLEGLAARIEATCFAKLSSEEPADVRARSYQHLAECRDLLGKLRELMGILTTLNSFERSPWIRALVIGSGIPGTGHKLRHRAAQFAQMGYHPPPTSGTSTPGGMPLHALLEDVLLAERDIVPTRVRWIDDKPLVGLWLAALVSLAVVAIAWVARTLG
ncbi:MAG: hypothetical protein EXR75_15960, partial [Myxococcales bacterium]|nr:hypothetical protein [Myxococcales bacterium]